MELARSGASGASDVRLGQLAHTLWEGYGWDRQRVCSLLPTSPSESPHRGVTVDHRPQEMLDGVSSSLEQRASDCVHLCTFVQKPGPIKHAHARQLYPRLLALTPLKMHSCAPCAFAAYTRMDTVDMI